MFRLPNREPSCTRCSLGLYHEKRKAPAEHQCAVFGQSECDRDEVKLVVVGRAPLFTTDRAFPSTRESRLRDYSHFPSELFRQMLGCVFSDDEDFLSQVFFTYAVKCPTRSGKTSFTVGAKEVRQCSSWLSQEIASVPPETPLLLLSSLAVQALLPNLKGGVWANRQRIHHVGSHPAIISFPIEQVENTMLRRITAQDKRAGELMAFACEFEKLIVGSVPFFFRRDLQLLKSLYGVDPSEIPR